MFKGLLIATLFFTLNVVFADEFEIFKHLDDNNYDKVIELLEKGVDPNITNPRYFKNTPLIEIAFKLEKRDERAYEIGKLLLEKGANPNIKNSFGTNAGLVAVKFHRSSMFLHDMMEHGLDLSQRFHNDETYLHLSMENGYLEAPEIIHDLIQFGMDVNAKNKQGVTPLMEAMERNVVQYEGCGARRIQIAQLIQAGADVNIEDTYGDTALIYGIYAINEEYCPDLQDLEILLKNGAKVTDDAFKASKKSDITNLLKKYQ